MSPILRLCNGCHRPFPPADMKRGRCSTCGPAYEREKSRRRRATSTATRVRDSRAWQRLRETVRARDGGCTQRHNGSCYGRLEVHHIRPLEQGGTNELTNLVTLCRAHHGEAEAQTRQTGGF